MGRMCHDCGAPEPDYCTCPTMGWKHKDEATKKLLDEALGFLSHAAVLKVPMGKNTRARVAHLDPWHPEKGMVVECNGMFLTVCGTWIDQETADPNRVMYKFSTVMDAMRALAKKQGETA